MFCKFCDIIYFQVRGTMEKKILEIVENYTKRNKRIDYEALVQILSILVKENRLEDFIKKLGINKKPHNDIIEDSLASYYDGAIYLYTDVIEDFLKCLQSVFSMCSSDEILFVINIELVLILLHETRHAMQRKVRYENTTFESKLFSFCVLSEKLCENPLPCRWYFDPTERDAENYALSFIIQMLEIKTIEFQNIVEYYEFKKVRNLLYDYTLIGDKIISPIEKYARQTFDKETYDCLKPFSKKQMEEIEGKKRINYGLPITLEEYIDLGIEKEKAYTKLYCPNE